jgi:hypothetical protein
MTFCFSTTVLGGKTAVEMKARPPGGILIRNPLILVAVAIAFYAYYLVREFGHLLASRLPGLRVASAMRYKIFPGFDLYPSESGTADVNEAVFIVAGPAMALLAGYALLLLLLRRGSRLHPAVRSTMGILCYLALMLDPVYYAIIPLLKLGGEPEMLARVLSISTVPIMIVAVGVLVLNTYLIQRFVMPLIREGGRGRP